jgi:hypothetical protein
VYAYCGRRERTLGGNRRGDCRALSKPLRSTSDRNHPPRANRRKRTHYALTGRVIAGPGERMLPMGPSSHARIASLIDIDIPLERGVDLRRLLTQSPRVDVMTAPTALSRVPGTQIDVAAAAQPERISRRSSHSIARPPVRPAVGMDRGASVGQPPACAGGDREQREPDGKHRESSADEDPDPPVRVEDPDQQQHCSERRPASRE